MNDSENVPNEMRLCFRGMLSWIARYITWNYANMGTGPNTGFPIKEKGLLNMDKELELGVWSPMLL